MKREKSETPTAGRDDDLLLPFTGLASLIMLAFFFFLRPVIGPAADWDLFALPSFFYTPWLALYIHRGLGRRPDFAQTAWPVMVLALVSVGPWLSLNVDFKASTARFKDLMEWEAPRNPWAASYGYLRLGKYLSRDPLNPRNPEIYASLDRALAINPRSAALRGLTADVYKAMGRDDLADPQFAEQHLLLAEYHERKGQYPEAARDYETALALAPKSRAALAALVRLYSAALPDPQKAARYQKELDQLAAPGPGQPVPH